ncbi:MAG: hypothetical protein U0R18_00290 [Mycobacterium sp.]
MAGPPYPYTGQPLPYPEPFRVPPPFPGPPPRRPRRRGRALGVVVACLAVVAGIVVAAVLAGRGPAPSSSTGLTADAVKVAIQKYLDALSDGDIQTISRNTLCGLYDGVKDRRTDDALARMSSDAFQKQFAKADVTSVDTMVFSSANSAQVLFTMKVAPATGSRDGGGIERQAVAQVLAHDNQILVCSYVQRAAGTF